MKPATAGGPTTWIVIVIASFASMAHGQPPTAPSNGRLSSYVARALDNNPELRASFERWHAATRAVPSARALPDPTIKYSAFVRRVETRVGPQRHKLSLAQTFPWPTRLTAGADAASKSARALERQFDAQALAVRAQVADAYWRLWHIHEEHRLKREHDLVLETLANTVRGRVRTGAASLADLNQVELGVARHHDHHGQHREAGRAAQAELRRAVGAPLNRTIRVSDTPNGGLPVKDEAALVAIAKTHPHVDSVARLAEASESTARATNARRLPNIVLGLDWIETGSARAPNVAGSGKDALIVSAGLSVPLWARSHRGAAKAARHRAAAQRAEAQAAQDRAVATVQTVLSAVRDADRRITLYERTLIPQAETTYRAVLGSYQTGRSTVASALLAQRELLELQLELAKSRSEHARAWAALEYAVGQPLQDKIQ